MRIVVRNKRKVNSWLAFTLVVSYLSSIICHNENVNINVFIAGILCTIGAGFIGEAVKHVIIYEIEYSNVATKKEEIKHLAEVVLLLTILYKYSSLSIRTVTLVVLQMSGSIMSIYEKSCSVVIVVILAFAILANIIYIYPMICMTYRVLKETI